MHVDITARLPLNSTIYMLMSDVRHLPNKHKYARKHSQGSRVLLRHFINIFMFYKEWVTSSPILSHLKF